MCLLNVSRWQQISLLLWCHFLFCNVRQSQGNSRQLVNSWHKPSSTQPGFWFCEIYFFFPPEPFYVLSVSSSAFSCRTARLLVSSVWIHHRPKVCYECPIVLFKDLQACAFPCCVRTVKLLTCVLGWLQGASWNVWREGLSEQFC